MGFYISWTLLNGKDKIYATVKHLFGALWPTLICFYLNIPPVDFNKYTNRFWWRDTRLAELGSTPLLPPPYTKSHVDHYQFPYPTRILPVPYHTDTKLMTLYQNIIPFARTARSLTVQVPDLPTPTPPLSSTATTPNQDGMDVEPPPFVFGQASTAPGSADEVVVVVPRGSRLVTTIVQSDGLLLYVAEASYESGTSPLSNWVPITSYDVQQQDGESKLMVGGSDSGGGAGSSSSGPLDVFERSVSVTGE